MRYMLPSGRRVYVFQYRNRHNQTRRFKIGYASDVKAERARKRAEELAGEVVGGLDPSDDRNKDREAPTVNDLAKRYHEDHAERNKKAVSAKTDKAYFRNYINPALGKRKIASITLEDIERLHHSLSAKPTTANRVLALFSKALNLADRWGWRENNSNPSRHVDKFGEQERERFLSSEELVHLGDALAEAERNNTETPYAIAALRLLVLTGCRKSEILTLQWNSVDFEQHLIRLLDSKTGARVVYLGAPAIQVLGDVERVNDNPYVIVGEKEGSHLGNLRKVWLRIRKAAGLDDVRMHDLRHHYGSAGASSGLSMALIGKMLGHTQVRTTQRYAHLAPDPVRQAVESVSSGIDAAMRGKNAKVVKARPT